MSLCLTSRIERVTGAVSRRTASLFAVDCAANAADLRKRIAGRRVLVSGGAGSIGSATIMELLALRPAALCIIDPSENNLAELVRTMRSGSLPLPPVLQPEPLDYGEPLTHAFLAAQAPFDVVLSFAALKHVRSERDEFSLLRMLDVNLVKADRFLAALRRQGHGRDGVFFVSTDKAADPVSLMGASKRAMELLLWAHTEAGAPASLIDGGNAPPLPRATTTRFANVAFSDGSLPWSFLQRLEKGQSLAAPVDVRRYLVSPVEAGQLCLLAALICPHRRVLVPNLDPARDLVSFIDIAAATLRDLGLEPAWYDDETAARGAVARERAAGRYPVLRTTSDTSGEKDIEIFVGADEQAESVGLQHAQAVATGPVDRSALARFLSLVDAACRSGRPPVKAALVTALAAVVPALRHQETGLSLDGKM